MKSLGRILAPMIMVGLLVLPGFASQEPSPAQNSQQLENIPFDKAVVYIYRPRTPQGKIPFDVKANGIVLTTLVPSGYYVYVTEPGAIEFTAFETGPMARGSIFSITVDAKAGQAYYLKGRNGKFGGSARLESVSPEAGAQEIANRKLITPTLGSTSGPTSTLGKTVPSAPVSTSASTLGASFKGETIPADKAIVYIYRPSPPGGLAGCVAADVGIPFGLKASGKAVTTLTQGGYYAYVTEPGNIEFTAIEDKYSGPLAAKSPFSITLDAKAGQTYYLKGSHTHGLNVSLSLVSVSQGVGSKEIVNCKLITTTLASASAPTTATQQVVATANAYGEKIFVGTIESSASTFDIPSKRKIVVVADNGDKLIVFVSRDIAIRDMHASPTRKGKRAEVKYSPAANGDNEAISFRYIL